MSAVGGGFASVLPAVREELAQTPVVVLFGGTSNEREVSLASGRAIASALGPEAGLPGGVCAVEIMVDGAWAIEGAPGPLDPAAALAHLPADALYFLGLHGGEGEDGTLQAFLEHAGRRYTGSGPAASALCMDKGLARLAFSAAGLRVAPGRVVRAAEWRSDPAAISGELAGLAEGLGSATDGRLYVKPNAGGSSVLAARIESEDRGTALVQAIDAIMGAGFEALVEAAITGLEVTAGVIGNASGPLASLPIVEIVPKAGRFFDYEEKYTETGAEEFCPPAHLSGEAAARIQAEARTAYLAGGCEGYARIDFIVPGCDPHAPRSAGERLDGGDPVILEANTLPGFTPRSLLPLAAAAIGLDFRALCLELCALALVRGSRS